MFVAAAFAASARWQLLQTGSGRWSAGCSPVRGDGWSPARGRLVTALPLMRRAAGFANGSGCPLRTDDAGPDG